MEAARRFWRRQRIYLACLMAKQLPRLAQTDSSHTNRSGLGGWPLG
jgi:hypothetical protein